MKTMIKLVTLSALFVIACGDNKEVPDARVSDGKPADAYCSDCPAAPTLGTQMDREGRAAVNTVLNHGFDGTAAAGMPKDDYNADGNAAMWAQTWAPEFMKNLAIIDSLDSGFCGNGRCETGETNALCGVDCSAAAVPAGNGCSNQVLYNAGMGGGPNTMSYLALAGILASDELYLDTSKTMCTFYLAVEFGVVSGGGNTTCGGRTPQYDVIDYSLSILSAGTSGIDTNLQPKIKDNAEPHTDYLTDFPFLGMPH